MHTIRQIPLDSQDNFRDLGGYPTNNGQQVHHKRLYRSGNLDHITAADQERIRQLGIRTVIDFRHSSEVQADQAFWHAQGTRYIHLPINPGNLATQFWDAIRTGDASALPDDILSVNNRLILNEARHAYGALFKQLADPEALPLLFNCSHGKDRTGIAAALILIALGVPTEHAQTDYLASNHFREAENRKDLAALKASLAERNSVDLHKIEAAFTLQPHHFEAILDTVHADYGTFAGYYKRALELNETTLEAMRSNLLNPPTA